MVSTQPHEHRFDLRLSMRFLVPRVGLIRLLRVVCHAAHPLLRIEASGGVVTLACGDTEAGCEVTISQPGVCFLRHSKLKKLLQSYHSNAGQSAAIEIEVLPEFLDSNTPPPQQIAIISPSIGNYRHLWPAPGRKELQIKKGP